MLTTERVAGAALAALALGVLWANRVHPVGSLRNPGPGYLPLVLALLLLALALTLVLAGRRAPRLAAAGWGDWRHAAAVVGACLFAALALERLGYRLTVGVILVFLLGVVERRGVLTALIIAAGLALASFFLFNTVLRVPLPRGPGGL